jgi:hypothetical protein
MKVFPLPLFLTLSVPLFSQMERDKDDFSLELISNYAYYKNFGSRASFGLQAELMLSKYFGLQMSAAGNQNYVTFNGPALLVPLGILIGDSKGSARDVISLIEILFWASAVENPALHIPINDRVELITYASLCRIRYWWNESEPFASEWMASGSLGVKANYSLSKNWYVSLGGEYTQLYYYGRPKGFQISLALGKILKPR